MQTVTFETELNMNRVVPDATNRVLLEIIFNVLQQLLQLIQNDVHMLAAITQ